jgi:ribosomal 50S subunit-associated protein YjgA (DUF615 family)
MLNCFKSRKEILKDEVGKMLKNPSDVDKVLEIFYKFEMDNLAAIQKLNREKDVTMNKINGAIKQFLHAHPILTKELIGSLSKRIYGSLLVPKKQGFFRRLFKWKG